MKKRYHTRDYMEENMTKNGLFTIHGNGDVEVIRVKNYLSDLEHAYNSIYVFFDLIQEVTTKEGNGDSPLIWRTSFRPLSWPLTPKYIATRIPHFDRLVLKAVKLQSPGFWEFIGKLNPLEVIRLYLNDRHERRKDHKYRESAEKRKLDLENAILETKLRKEQIKVVKSLSGRWPELSEYLNTFIHEPLEHLDQYQDKGLIKDSELEKYKTYEGH